MTPDRPGKSKPSPAMQGISQGSVWGMIGGVVFLGLDGGVPCFAADISAWAPEDGGAPAATGITDPARQPHPDLPDGVAFEDLRNHMASIELNLINEALERTQGVVAHAAQLLGLRRTTLVEKLRKYGIERDQTELAG